VVRRLARPEGRAALSVEDMPFLADGTVPRPDHKPSRSAVSNDHRAPNRGYRGKGRVLGQVFTDATPMTGEDTFQKFGSRLEEPDLTASVTR
jgi:hypothetical protein